jgi:hypothetical protein
LIPSSGPLWAAPASQITIFGVAVMEAGRPPTVPTTGCAGPPGAAATSTPPGTVTTSAKPPTTHDHNDLLLEY